jgi:hypothetical protein
MSKNTKKYIGDIISTKVENVLYFIYFLNQGSLGSMVGGTFEDAGKALKIYFEATRTPKRTLWMLKILWFC